MLLGVAIPRSKRCFVSLWRPEIACIGWEASRIGVARRRGARVLAAEAIRIDGDATLEARVAALGALLSKTGGRARRAEIVVSDRHARYFLIDRPARVRGMAEFDGVIAAAFEARFGGGAEEWQLAWDLGAGATYGVACALPAALTLALRETARLAGARDISIQTYSVAMLRAHARALPESAWVATRADDQVTLGHHAQGRWHSLRTLEDVAAGPLDALVARERLRLADADASCPVIAMGDWPVGEAGARIVGAPDWTGRPADFGAQFRVALAGVAR